MFIKIGDKLRNIAGYSEITKDDNGFAVLTKKEGGIAHVINTPIDFDDLCAQMIDGGMLIAPRNKKREDREKRELGKVQPIPAKKFDVTKKPDSSTKQEVKETPKNGEAKANGKPAAAAPTKPEPKADAPKTTVTGEKPKAPVTKPTEKPADEQKASVNETGEPDYVGKVEDDRNGDEESGK